MTRPPLCPLSALIAHLESVIDDGRILVIADASRSIPEHLLERGARLVQVCDPNTQRVAQAAAHNTERRVSYTQLTDGALRDGSFDCVLVEDVELAPDLRKLMSGVSRSLSASGVAAICMRNDEGTTGLLGASRGEVEYDALCDAVDETFDASIMLGQSPFLGYSVVQFGLSEAPEPALDNAYLGGEAETPDFYIALCGSEEAISELAQEDMTIVQLPAARFVKDNAGTQGDLQRRAEQRAEALKSELTSLRRKDEAEETAKLQAELEQRDSWIRQLEARAESADARADDAQAQMDELEQELDDALTALDNARQDADAAVKARDAALKEQAALSEKNEPSKEELMLRGDLEDLKEELQDVQLLLQKRDKALAAKDEELKRLRQKIEESEHHEKEVEHISAGRDALEDELAALDEKNRKLKAALSDREHKMELLERRLVEQEKELDDLHQQLNETEDLLTRTRKEAAESAGPTKEELERDLRGLEQQLRERGRRIVELEGQLRKLESFAKTLKLELDQRGGSSAGADEELERLARVLAEREADLVEAKWKIGQLSQTAVSESNS